ncbi:hypothetical protein DERP_010646 [Dermatophagoides pteronyssinus]|uniref:Uncharacterized protein n=1 Tax=Dermatophagoides pteronyssinus TaxID=6956 RepID=A0ABQ8JA45_DERPT|nr:hypothetical protein DERP_010646 [Dermatophagoides pteronyssinus]
MNLEKKNWKKQQKNLNVPYSSLHILRCFNNNNNAPIYPKVIQSGDLPLEIFSISVVFTTLV